MSQAKTLEEFISESIKVHGNFYDYSKAVYVNNHTPITLTCPIHGDFDVIPKLHIYKKRGCKYCSRELLSKKYSMGKDNFIKKAREIHGDFYDYSKVVYKNNKTDVIITCPIHGEFEQTPNEHLSGRGCNYCGLKRNAESKFLTKEEWVERARKVHGGKYDYSKVVYTNARDEVIIICPEHGEFTQIAYSHLQGKGCPCCNESKLEREIRLFLDENNINYVEYCKNDILKFLGRFSLDFYLPDYNAAIECQGEQHFYPINFFGGKEKYEKTISRDKNKKNICNENGIKILYYSNLGVEYPYLVFEDKDKLLNEIKNEKCINKNQ